jgi:Zn-dependent alcohol dehydrogenase
MSTRKAVQPLHPAPAAVVDINVAYDDMLAGRNIRGVIVHDH